jgi:hypothetical protein
MHSADPAPARTLPTPGEIGSRYPYQEVAAAAD